MISNVQLNRCLPSSNWPEQDRLDWERACAASDPFDVNWNAYASSLRLDTQIITRKGYGVWLHFLAHRGWLDPFALPLARVTPERLVTYFNHLRTAGNADLTIIGRFDQLARAIKILQPGQDVRWIRRPFGATIYSLLPKCQPELFIPDSRELFDWGVDMMETAKSPDVFRNGLFLALLASRGRRLRSMSLIRVGKELVLRGDRYRIELKAWQVKTGKPDHFNIPDILTPYVHRYLTVVRPVLLGDHLHDALWITARGKPWKSKAIQNQITALTAARFGTAFGPHRARHALATLAESRVPGGCSVAAQALGISKQVARTNYSRAVVEYDPREFDKVMAARAKKLASEMVRSARPDQDTG